MVEHEAVGVDAVRLGDVAAGRVRLERLLQVQHHQARLARELPVRAVDLRGIRSMKFIITMVVV